MPSGQPFTMLCQQLARPRFSGRADLHLHSTFSDGTYSPQQLVDLANRSGLCAIALTDHDTLDGIECARQSAGALEIISGVEITTEYRGKELHLLGFFVRVDDPPLRHALDALREDRVERFNEMIGRLRTLGVELPAEICATAGKPGTLGRRNLAEMLVQCGKTKTVREGFQRYLSDRGRATVPKRRLPVGEAIRLVNEAGGVAAWAHPNYDCTRETLAELRGFGMKGLEVDFPSCRQSRAHELRQWAAQFGMAVTGGSDCHGPDQPGRAPGTSGVTQAELDHLREVASV
jgi:predicted metal-dependent phosphoesterase TrpH